MFVISSFEVEIIQKWNCNLWDTSKRDSKMTLKTRITKLRGFKDENVKENQG